MADPLADAAAGYQSSQERAQAGGVDGGIGAILATVAQIRNAIASNPGLSGGNLLTDPFGAGAAALAGFNLSATEGYGGSDAPSQQDELEGFLRGLQSDQRRLITVQERLFALGEYPDGVEPRYGTLDPITLEVISRWASGAANITEREADGSVRMVPFMTTLHDQVRDLADPTLADAALDPDPVGTMLANPQDLGRLLEATYARAGKRPSTADRQAFVAAFHALQRESALAEARYKMQMEQGTAAEMTSPMDPTTAAEAYLRREDPGAIEARQGADILQSLDVGVPS